MEPGDEALQHLQSPGDLRHLETLHCGHSLQVSGEAVLDGEETLDDTEAGPVEDHQEEEEHEGVEGFAAWRHLCSLQV